jgi:malate dehydrogenase
MDELRKSYQHLTDLRQQVIEMGVIPPVEQWHSINPNL